jgi:hypothetical protein
MQIGGILQEVMKMILSCLSRESKQHVISPAVKSKSKGKAIPLQALTGPKGSRKLRLPDFKTIGT